MGMLEIVVAAALASNVVPGVVGGLEGCWNARGHVRSKDATSIARGEWHLGKHYFILHLRSVPPVAPYEAAITYGAGEKPGQIGSFWMDTFGGLYEPSLGLGAVEANGFELDYHFPDAIYQNRFLRTGSGWRWTITEQVAGKPDEVFANYELAPTSCRRLRFGF